MLWSDVSIAIYIEQRKMKKLYFIIIILFISCSNKSTDKIILGDDFRLFQGTVAWELAQAVDCEDTHEIMHQVKDLKIPINYQENKFGQSVLMVAVRTNKEKSVHTLLALGANPNLPNDSVNGLGQNSVLLASRFSKPSKNILELLLKYGGDPNSTECGVKKNNLGIYIPARSFALFEAVYTSFDKVKLLIKYGANINLSTTTTPGGAAYAAISKNRMDILLYLLNEGFDYHQKFEEINLDDSLYSTFDVDILYELRFCIYPLNSKEYRDKLKVISFLKKKGLDYTHSPIPDSAISIIKEKIAPKNQKELKEYIEKY